MNRRNVLSLSVLPLASGCFYDRFFELEWDEEAQQPDGSIIVVHRKERWERYSQGLTPYGGRNIFRESTLTIDAGGSVGRVSQVFRGFAPQYVGQHEGSWYAVIKGDYPSEPPSPVIQDWGKFETDWGQLALKLNNRAWRPISMRELPDAIQKPNLMLPADDLSKLAKFAGKPVRLSDKDSLGQQPSSPSRASLLRPRSTAR
jgi:hypothetical protein